MDDGLPGELRERKRRLRQVHLGRAPERQDRHPLSGRRFRQRPSRSVPRRAWRQGEDDGGGQGELRGERSDAQLADHLAQGGGRRHALSHHPGPLRGAGGRRHARPGGLERAHLPALRRHREKRHRPGRQRQAHGRHLDRQHQGSDRSELGERQGGAGLSRLGQEIHAGPGSGVRCGLAAWAMSRRRRWSRC